MTLVRYQPWSLHRELWNEVNQLFDRASASNDGSAGGTAEWAPTVDIEEHRDKFVLTADVPGVDPAGIEITLEGGVLTLSGTREQAAPKDGAESRRNERVTGRFHRRFSLPDTVDAEAVQAQSKHGVLEITIPKRAAIQPRRITVNA